MYKSLLGLDRYRMDDMMEKPQNWKRPLYAVDLSIYIVAVSNFLFLHIERKCVHVCLYVWRCVCVCVSLCSSREKSYWPELLLIFAAA